MSVYNRFLVDMMFNLKRSYPGLKRALAAKHKAVDPESARYIQAAARTLPLERLLAWTPAALARDDGPEDASAEATEAAGSATGGRAQLLGDAAVRAFEPLPDISIAAILADAPAPAASADAPVTSTTPEATLVNYVYILATLAATYDDVQSSPASEEGNADIKASQDQLLVRHVLKALAHAQQGDLSRAGDITDCIMNDAIVGLLEHVADTCVQVTDPDVASGADAAGAGAGAGPSSGDKAGPPQLDDLMQAFGNSRIAELAKEISQEVDITKLPLNENPADLLDFSNLSDSNSLLGSIVSKVGSKIQNKLATGELKHEELLGDALSMLQKLDASGQSSLLGNLFSGAAGGSGGAGGALASLFGGGGARGMSARQRLRAKHQHKSGGGNGSGSGSKRG